MQFVYKVQYFTTVFAFPTVLRVTTWSSTLQQQYLTTIVRDAVLVVKAAMDLLNIIVYLVI